MRRGSSILAPVVAVALAVSLASEAGACSLVWRNMFADVGAPPGARELRAARYVDWVEIAAKGPPACERDRAWTDEDLEADFDPEPPTAKVTGALGVPAADAIAPPMRLNPTVEGFESRTCAYRVRQSPLYALEARVIESLKGAGPAVFPLAYSWDRAAAPDRAYSDPRTAMSEVGQQLPGSHADAAARHDDPGFLDHGQLHEDRDRTDSCGGELTAMIGGRYVAFRSASGTVLVLEPVADRSDPWFDRVRRFATDPDAFAGATLDVADFFRGSTGLAVVKVQSCVRPGGDLGTARIKATVLRGTLSTNWRFAEAGTDSPYWIPDYLQKIGAPCRAGRTLLAMSGPFDSGVGSPPRAARVVGAKVRTRDLLSGYRLVGPRMISIDQAFPVGKGRWKGVVKTSRTSSACLTRRRP